jgi:DNA-directed RNA polymerase specialized sigma24 family protein
VLKIGSITDRKLLTCGFATELTLNREFSAPPSSTRFPHSTEGDPSPEQAAMDFDLEGLDNGLLPVPRLVPRYDITGRIPITVTPPTQPGDEPGARPGAPFDLVAVTDIRAGDALMERLDVIADPVTHEVTSSVDQRIIDLVREAGAESKLANDLEKELKDFGFGTIIGLNSKNLLFRRLTKMRIYLPRPPTDYRKEARALIYLSVHTVSPPFMVNYVFGESWDPMKSSLRTCFVNACLCQFGVEYRQYCKEERHSKGEEPEFEDQFESDFRQHYAPRPSPDPQVQAVDRTEIERLLSVDMSPKDKIMFIRTAQGFSQKEIADELGMSERAVSSKMRRNRKRIADLKRDR